MAKYTIETSLQFPVFKLTELVTYSEVKKPSGVAYIILVLIKDSKQRSARLTDTLINFGVPERLHYIFLDAINDLLHQNLITIGDTERLSPAAFKLCSLSNFSFTEKGEKIFADGYIPATDNYGNPIEKETKVEIFYDVAMSSFFLKLPDDLEGKPLKDASIESGFFENLIIKKSEEDFINSSKGSKIGIKKEEIVTKVETQIRENWIVKHDCSIELEENTARILFDDRALQEFFEQNYRPEIVTNAINLKNKFQFPYPSASFRRLSEVPENSIKRLLLPKDLGEIIKQKIRLMITKGKYNGDGLVISTNDALPFEAEFIRVNAQGQGTAYAPARFIFNVDGLGEIEIPLALELIVEHQELLKVLQPIVSSLVPYSLENFDKLVRITECSKDYETAYIVMEQYLSQVDNARKLSILSEMRQYTSSSPTIATKIRAMTTAVFDSCIESVKESELESLLKISSWVPKYIGTSSKEVLDKIFSALQKINNPVDVFSVLSEARFDEALVCSYVNPVPEVIRNKAATHPSLVSLIAFINAVDTMKTVSGINDMLHFIIDEESIDKTTFRSAYVTASSERKRIRQFVESNKALFEKYDEFMRLFSRINDDLNMMDNARRNPNIINLEIIDKKINAGEFQYAFVNLSGKLESILKTKFGLDGTLSDMLSEARKRNIIDKDIVSDLHEFREARNANVHLDMPQTKFTPEDLRRWSKEIFELQEDKDK